jgi:hypothetical protein
LKNKRLKLFLLLIIGILLIPFFAMFFTNEVHWTFGDFIVMGLLLLTTALILEFTLRKITTKQNRVVIVIIIIMVFLLVWAELAVGIFNSWFSKS